MRDRLIEIVDKAKEEYANDVTDHTETEYIVESLFNNGVVVPPVSVEQTVYRVYWNYSIDTCRVSALTQKSDKSWKIRVTSGISKCVFEITPAKLGKTVFLTKEEAEAKLKEGKG
jgi:hypothetical protein